MGCLHDSLSTIAHGSLHHYVSYISAPYTCPWSISHIFWVMSAAKNNVTSNHTSILTLMDNTILSTKVANSDVWSRDFSVMYSIGYVWIWNLQFKFWMPACFLLGQIHLGHNYSPSLGSGHLQTRSHVFEAFFWDGFILSNHSSHFLGSGCLLRLAHLLLRVSSLCWTFCRKHTSFGSLCRATPP